MRFYTYCDHCGSKLPRTWELSTRKILEALFESGECVVRCEDCDEMNDYYKDDLLDELADRIDNKE